MRFLEMMRLEGGRSHETVKRGNGMDFCYEIPFLSKKIKELGTKMLEEYGKCS